MRCNLFLAIKMWEDRTQCVTHVRRDSGGDYLTKQIWQINLRINFLFKYFIQSILSSTCENAMFFVNS